MSNKDLKLFDDQGTVQAPEDPAPLFQEPESKTFTPLFDPSPLSSPPQQPEQTASQTGLFAQETLKPLPTNTVTRDQSTTLFHQAPMADPPAPKVPAEVGPAFDIPRDPMVEQTLRNLLQSFPDTEGQENSFRQLMEGIFPLTIQQIESLGEVATREEGALVAEAKRLTEIHQTMGIQETLSGILRAAKVAHDSPHGALGFLHKIESAAKFRGNPEDWHRQLGALKISIHGLSGKLPPFLDTAAEIQNKLSAYAKLAKVLADSTQDPSLKDAIQRRETLLLGALQQTQISLKQVEQMRDLLRVESQQLEEAKTITLPALGFTL